MPLFQMPLCAVAVPTLLVALALPALAQKSPPAQEEVQTEPEAPIDAQTEAPAAVPGAAAQIVFGDDSGAYPRDGECDDRRFAGPGMATFLAWETTGRDATDCQQLMAAGRITYWDPAASAAATQCQSIDFGDDTGDFPADYECDDMRFEGRGMAGFVQDSLILRDATDCRAYCEAGLIGLRDY